MSSTSTEEFQNATKLRDSGLWDEAAREFRRLASQADGPDEKSALLINEHRCYCDAGRLDEAKAVLEEIRNIAPSDPSVRLIIDFGEACMNVQAGNTNRGLEEFEKILHNYPDLREGAHRYIYESIQRRKGIALAEMGKYAKAISVLGDGSEFVTLTTVDFQEVHFYLGMCHDELGEFDKAKEQYTSAIDAVLRNDFEAHARYRIAIICFKLGAFAQAKLQLLTILENAPLGGVPNLPKRYVYEQLSRTSTYLGETADAEKFSKMAKMS